MHELNNAGHGVCLRIFSAALAALGIHACVNAQSSVGTDSADPVAAAASQQADARRVNVSEYIVRGNSVLTARDIEKAVYAYLGPDRTMADIEAARDALQEVYHQSGYQSVYVDLPEQQVSGGVVILQVTETKVGRLRVVGAKHYSPLEIRDEVPALKEGEVPDFNEAQTQLTALNRTASRQVMPLVREGKMPGTMDVDLRVEDKSPWNASVGLNNDYSADTEKLRAMVTLGHDNLWQRGHAFSVTYFTAPEEPSNAKVWSGSYTMPLSGKWSLQFSGYHSDSNVATIGGTNVLGKGYSFGMMATYAMEPLGNWHNSLSVGVDYKNFDESLMYGGDGDEVPLKYVPFTLAYDGYRYTETSQSSVSLSVVGATRTSFGVSSSDEEFDYKRYMASPSFALLRGDLTHTQTVGNDWQAFLRTGFQLASGALVSNEQFSAGGATSVRGYLAAERSADEGLMASLELRTPSLSRWLGPQVNEWRFFAFSDWAFMRLRDPLPDQERSFGLASVGLGTRMQLFDWLHGGLVWGYALRDGDVTKKNESRVNFNLRANF